MEFYKGLDCVGNDIKYVGGLPIQELMKIAEETEDCMAFNTIGYLKFNIDLTNLVKSELFNTYDGLYVIKSRYDAYQKKTISSDNAVIEGGPLPLLLNDCSPMPSFTALASTLASTLASLASTTTSTPLLDALPSSLDQVANSSVISSQFIQSTSRAESRSLLAMAFEALDRFNSLIHRYRRTVGLQYVSQPDSYNTPLMLCTTPRLINSTLLNPNLTNTNSTNSTLTKCMSQQLTSPISLRHLLTNRPLDLSLGLKYKFFKEKDFVCYDFKYVGPLPIDQLMLIADQYDACIGFNTLGHFKCHVDINKLITPTIFTNSSDGIYVHMERYKKNNLNTLAEFYKLDKAITFGHNYIPTYEQFFNDRKNSTRKLLEIGIGCLEEGQMAHMKQYNYVTGNSLRMWRDYFHNATIYGIDIFEKAMFPEGSENRIITMVADQSVATDLDRVAKAMEESIDIIIDDGSHVFAHQVFTFMFMEKYLSANGIYIIEDISAADMQGFKDLTHFPEIIASTVTMDSASPYEFVEPHKRRYREYLLSTYNITCIDTRGAHNNYNDIMCIFERKCPTIFIKGIAGLTNNIFQIFAAIPYAEKAGCNARIILDKGSELLHYGSSNRFNRDVTRKVNGACQSYLDNIFNKLDSAYLDPRSQKGDPFFIDATLSNDIFSANTYNFETPENKYDKILIDGYCQNIELFYNYKDKLLKYINFSDKSILEYVKNKYGFNDGFNDRSNDDVTNDDVEQ